MSSAVRVTLTLLGCGATSAPDLLPLKHGIYVPTGVVCRGASRAAMVNYWGGKSAIGDAHVICTIRELTRRGRRYTFNYTCREVASSQAMKGGPTVLTIESPTAFRMDETSYRYCGPKPM